MYNLKRYTNKEKNPPKEIKKKLRSKETNECQTNKQQPKKLLFLST